MFLNTSSVSNGNYTTSLTKFFRCYCKKCKQTIFLEQLITKSTLLAVVSAPFHLIPIHSPPSLVYSEFQGIYRVHQQHPSIFFK